VRTLDPLPAAELPRVPPPLHEAEPSEPVADKQLSRIPKRRREVGMRVLLDQVSALTTYPPRLLTSYPPRGAGAA
jgi:hypothetical protein